MNETSQTQTPEANLTAKMNQTAKMNKDFFAVAWAIEIAGLPDWDRYLEDITNDLWKGEYQEWTDTDRTRVDYNAAHDAIQALNLADGLMFDSAQDLFEAKQGVTPETAGALMLKIGIIAGMVDADEVARNLKAY